jgi:hypothetical protein
MRTAVSIPNPVFQAAEDAAARLSLSRSQLYTRAIVEFVQLHVPSNVTQQLDAVYAKNSSDLDPASARMQRLSLQWDAW